MIQHAHDDIDTIFYKILPKHGMKPRKAQIKLCHEMLDTMRGTNIALCDAGVGIGKTFSYLVAGAMISKHCPKDNRPIIISTASIALQKAIVTEYIPFLSNLLFEENMIDEPFEAIVRKGKSHYVCDCRFEKRVEKVKLKKKNKVQLDALRDAIDILDLDEIGNLSTFDKRLICVPNSCTCKLEYCRYKCFIKQSKSPKYLFQICNHNFLMADSIHKSKNMPPLLPESSAIVVDEAHKLPDAARQMFGSTLSTTQMKTLVVTLKNETLTRIAIKFKACLTPIIADLDSIDFGEEDTTAYTMTATRKRNIENALSVLNSEKRKIDLLASLPAKNLLCSVIGVLSVFNSQKPEYIFHAAIDENGDTALFAILVDIDKRMKSTFWNLGQPIVLTSGTLSVGKCFRRFREEVGLKYLRRSVTESIAASPFDYKNNCLLYFPQNSISRDNEYYSDMAFEIEQILTATHGHGLLLFTSYSDMSKVFSMLRHLPYPKFIMSKNSYNIIEQFKQSKNGVLFATGAIWEC